MGDQQSSQSELDDSKSEKSSQKIDTAVLVAAITGAVTVITTILTVIVAPVLNQSSSINPEPQEASEGASSTPSPSTDGPIHAVITTVEPTEKPEIYVAVASLKYFDGDELVAEFEINCSTHDILPLNYVLTDANGKIKMRGDRWNEPFQPEYTAEHQLIRAVCRSE